MGKPVTAIWPIEPHTLAKHTILEKYLEAWLPIMGSYDKNLVYVDGFAGPGVYSGGEDGSPIIALNVAKAQRVSIPDNLSMLFIENYKDRFVLLANTIKELSATQPPHVHIKTADTDFENTMTSILDDLDKDNEKLAPTFAFLDPFGYSDFSMDLVRRLLSYEKSEMLITFMNRDINRFLEVTRGSISRMFGSPDCFDRKNKKAGEDDRDFLVRVYKEQLLKNGAKHTRSFEMRDSNDNVIYNMIFATKHWRGLEVMKDAMLKVDDRGTYTFSDKIGFGQTFFKSIRNDAYWAEDVGNIIFRQFSGKKVKVEEIREFVAVNTEYPFKRRKIFSLMQENHPGRIISVTKPDGKPARKNAFSDNFSVQFS